MISDECIGRFGIQHVIDIGLGKISNMLYGSLKMISITDFIEIVVSKTVFGACGFLRDIVTSKDIMRWSLFFCCFEFDDGDMRDVVVFFLGIGESEFEIEINSDSFSAVFVDESDAFVFGYHTRDEFFFKISSIDSIVCISHKSLCRLIYLSMLRHVDSVSIFSNDVVISVFELEECEIRIHVASGSHFDSIFFTTIMCMIKIMFRCIHIDTFVFEDIFFIYSEDVKILDHLMKNSS